MGLYQKLRAPLIQFYLSGFFKRIRRFGYRLLRRGRPKVLFFHQIDDPHSRLAFQWIKKNWGQGSAADTHPEMETILIEGPGPDFYMEPDLQRRWALSDAELIASRRTDLSELYL